MTSTFPFLSSNNLNEFIMIAGSNQKIIYDVYTSASVPLVMTGGFYNWKLARYGQVAAVLTKAGSITGSQIIVGVESYDTQGLSGKYVHQLTIYDTSGSVFIPSQGIITITGLIS